LTSLPKLTTDDILKRFREKIPLVEDAEEFKIKQYNQQISDFIKEIRDLIAILKVFKKHTKAIVPIREQELFFYKNYLDFLVKYEDVSNKKI
jgi:thiamine phosphate synthase YjbQ (UPF0047 family)